MFLPLSLCLLMAFWAVLGYVSLAMMSVVLSQSARDGLYGESVPCESVCKSGQPGIYLTGRTGPQTCPCDDMLGESKGCLSMRT